MTERELGLVKSQQSPKLCEASRPLRQDGAGTAGPFDKAHGSELVEDLPDHPVARMRANEVSLILCPLPPLVPLWRDEARSGQKLRPGPIPDPTTFDERKHFFIFDPAEEAIS